MDRSIAVAVSSATTTTVAGIFQRHASPKQRPLSGSASGGRWGAENTYPVLYLARPTDSVTVEAYRHLVEPTDGMRPELVEPRRLVTCEVKVTNVLDLRDASNREKVGLSILDMTSDVGDYAPCHRVAQAAHQLELHGILAPAATGVGETLALFERRLPAEEQPELIEVTTWDGLPADPRPQRSRFDTASGGASDGSGSGSGDDARA
jgi:RES domain-containing protein